MAMPGRKFEASSGYRYGFNGKEKDNDINSLTAYDYGFRIYNPAIGKFMSVDPLSGQYPYFTPYQFAGNMPLAAIDLDGMEQFVVIYYKDQDGNKNVGIYVMTDNENNPLNQDVQKLIHNQRDGNNVAKGNNVLVFEIYTEGAKKDQMRIVDRPNDKLTAEEEKIWRENRTQLTEVEGLQYFAYPDKFNPTYYQSKLFSSSGTNAYMASGSLQDISWRHGKIITATPIEDVDYFTKGLNINFEKETKSNPGTGFTNKSEALSSIKLYAEELKANGINAINITITTLWGDWDDKPNFPGYDNADELIAARGKVITDEFAKYGIKCTVSPDYAKPPAVSAQASKPIITITGYDVTTTPVKQKLVNGKPVGKVTPTGAATKSTSSAKPKDATGKPIWK